MDDCCNRRHRAWRRRPSHCVQLRQGVDGAGDLQPRQVITLFHEMGHGLHQLLTEVGTLSPLPTA